MQGKREKEKGKERRAGCAIALIRLSRSIFLFPFSFFLGVSSRTTHHAPRTTFFLFLLPFSFLLSSGCRNCHLVETELRARENEVQRLREELHRSEAINNGLLYEMQAIRTGSSAKISPEQAAQTYMVKEVTLGRLTGGYDDDHTPGDESLQVVLEPRDPDGHAIKAPGSLHVMALEINAQGLKTPLGTWDIPPDPLRRTWRSGLLSTGYHVILPWKTSPASEKVRVVVRFVLSDGRMFEADKDVTVRLGRHPQSPRPAAPIEADTPIPPPRPVTPPATPGAFYRRPEWSDRSTDIRPATLWQTPPASPAARLLPPVAGEK